MKKVVESGRRSEEELRAIYDQGYVDQYDPHAVERIRRMVPFFDLAGDQIVADFGCGNGVLLELIASKVGQYVGVDFSEAFVHAAERRRNERGITNGAFHCADIVAFCAQHPGRFHAAFALDFSEHIYDAQFLAIFRAIHAALRPGSALYLHTPNREYFIEYLREWGVLNQIEGHVAVRDARAHQTLLAQSGFADVHVRHLPHYLPSAAALHGLGALPVIGRYFRARLLLTCRKALAETQA